MSLVALIAFAPAFLICAVAVRLSPKRLIFTASNRIGAHNLHFQILKFRTVRPDTLLAATHLMKDRNTFLTPIGDFLRESSGDELPQPTR